VYTQDAATSLPISNTTPIIIIGMTAAEKIAVNPIIEYQAATDAIAKDVTNVSNDNFICYLCWSHLSDLN
tara:strand:+ start:4 stop:213 length:210 start_codon:yes stop_codon:yes gene_type:complete